MKDVVANYGFLSRQSAKVLLAHVYGQLVTIVSAVAIPWACLANWDELQFGYFATALAGAAFFTISDRGYFSAIGNALIAGGADGEHSAAMCRSAQRAFGLPTVAFAAMALGGVTLAQLSASAEGYLQIFLSFVALAAMNAMMPIVVGQAAIYRFLGRVETGLIVLNSVRMLESGAVVLSAFWFGPVGTSVVAATIKLAIVSPYIFRRQVMVVSSVKGDDRYGVAEQGKSYAGQFIGGALSLHAFVALIGMLSPVAAATVATMRTVSRLPTQPISIVVSTLSLKLSKQVSEGGHSSASKAAIRIYCGSLVAALALMVLTIFALPAIETYWLHGKIQLKVWVVIIFSCAAFMSLSSSVQYVLMAAMAGGRRVGQLSSRVAFSAVVVACILAGFIDDPERRVWVVVGSWIIADLLMAIFSTRQFWQETRVIN